MHYSEWRKGFAVGMILVFLSASTTLGINTSRTNPQLLQVKQHTNKAIPHDHSDQPCLVGNVKVSSNSGDDYNPRMTTNAHGDIIIVYEQVEDISTKTIPVTFSIDEGATWSRQFQFNSLTFQGSGLLVDPDIIYNPVHDVLWFNAVDPLAEMYNEEMYFIPGDIENATEALGYAISGSTGDYFEAACAHTNDYFLSITIEFNYGPNYTRLLGFTWMTYPDFSYPPGMGGFYYDGQSIIQTAPLAEIEADYNANRWFLVAESGAIPGGIQICIKSGTTDKTLITSGEQKDNMDKYSDPEQAPTEFFGLGADPDVSGSGNNVAVVFVQDGNILCSVSSCVATYEPEFHWKTTTVETDNASTPAVYMQGNNIYVAYVKNGNLYYKTSKNAGVTWGEAQQKNDIEGTVVTQKGSVDICKHGIVFVDSRNGNYDVYFTEMERIAAPEITIDSISGGIGVTAVITNHGDIPSQDFNWSIAIEGNLLMGNRPLTGTLSSLQPGLSITIQRYIIGFGSILVRVKAGEAIKIREFTLFFIFVKEG